MSYERHILLDTTTETATGEGVVKDTISTNALYYSQPNVSAYLNVTAASGTIPTLDVTIVTTVDGVEYVLGTFAQLAVTGTERIAINNAPQDLKAKFAIGGGTPSFTFSVNLDR